jgi:DNA-directed RNA polymerase subunit RPC12/RpoP
MNRCPGGELRNLYVEEVKCLECGSSVELFSDEQRRKCPKCGTKVTRTTTPACASWCAAAKQCLGPERYAEALKTGQVASPAADGNGQQDSD